MVPSYYCSIPSKNKYLHCSRPNFNSNVASFCSTQIAYGYHGLVCNSCVPQTSMQVFYPTQNRTGTVLHRTESSEYSDADEIECSCSHKSPPSEPYLCRSKSHSFFTCHFPCPNSSKHPAHPLTPPRSFSFLFHLWSWPYP